VSISVIPDARSVRRVFACKIGLSLSEALIDETVDPRWARVLKIRRKIAPSVMPAASSQARSAATGQPSLLQLEKMCLLGRHGGYFGRAPRFPGTPVALIDKAGRHDRGPPAASSTEVGMCRTGRCFGSKPRCSAGLMLYPTEPGPPCASFCSFHLRLAFACLALLSLLAFLGVMILARMLQVIAAARSVMGSKPRARAISSSHECR
jgi:hypothetical protein